MCRSLSLKLTLVIFMVVLSGCAHESSQSQPSASLVSQGVTALKSHDYDRAHQAFNEVLRFNPKNCHVNFLNALTYQVQSLKGNYKDYQMAKAGFQLAFKFCLDDPWPSYYLGLMAQHDGKTDSARRYYLHSMQYAKSDTRRDILMTALGLAFDTNDRETARFILAKFKHYYPGSIYLPGLISKVARMRPVSSSVLNKSNKKADDQVKQCMVNAIIIVMRDDESKNRGVNLLSGLTLQYGNGTSPGFLGSFNNIDTSGWDKYINKTNDNNTGTLPDLPFSHLITNTISIPAVTYDLNIFNNKNAHDEILARPSILVENNKEAKYFSGTNLILGIEGTQGGQIQQFPLGVTLKVKPKFRKDGSLDMSIDVGREFLIKSNPETTTFNQVAQSINEDTRTTVNLHFGQTVVLSTLAETDDDSSYNKTPGLAKVPLLKDFFSNKQSSKVKTSVLFMLTPERIVDFYGSDKVERKSVLTQSYYDKLVHPTTNLDQVLQHVAGISLYHGVTSKGVNSAYDSGSLFSIAVKDEVKDVNSEGML